MTPRLYALAHCTPPFTIQLAANGRWEDAIAPERATDAWFAQSDTAMELVSETAFIGFRPATRNVPDIEELIRAFNEPLFAELGVFNHWRSAGPERIWQRGEPVPRTITIPRRFGGRRIALELSFGTHWLGIFAPENKSAGEIAGALGETLRELLTS
ncbi:MAG TPA: hypothetical protein VF698_04035 [Thermoanaerobaculia bacterium]|jgi:hypothetical protein